MHMRCEDIRELASAWLDGELDDTHEQDLVHTHLAECAACRDWVDRAEAVTRLVRIHAALPAPQAPVRLLASADAALPRPPGKVTVAKLLRWALLGVGLFQFLLGAGQISALAAAPHEHSPGTAAHLWHESAAWNVAIGAALAWMAWRRHRTAGLLPIMTAFVAVLTLLTVNDAVEDRVEPSRIWSHSLIVIAYLLLVASSLRRFTDQEPPHTARRPMPTWWRDQPDGRPSAAVIPMPTRWSAAQISFAHDTRRQAADARTASR